jgi:hypothetical protein
VSQICRALSVASEVELGIHSPRTASSKCEEQESPQIASGNCQSFHVHVDAPFRMPSLKKAMKVGLR